MSRKKHPNLPLYHTSGKKSIAKPQSVENSAKSVEKPSQNVEKSTKLVENLCKTSNNLCKTSGKPVQKCPAKVESSAPNVDKASATVENSSPAVENQAPSTPVMIKVSDVHKSFRLPTERASGLKQAILNALKGIKGYIEHQVLKGVSFEVHRGDFIGIVGRNGSGKSTLLKILAQIYYPEQGKVQVNGTLVPFIELGVGFNPELTGRENVYLNGALLGFSRKEMNAMYDEIVKFAELEQFMDAKLKNYSSGMQVRLAFSIAIRAKGDILILDEVLAVGDAEFQQKCNDYFASLKGDQTVILVTHDMGSVRRFCNRAILIEDGQVRAEGDPETVAQAYEDLWK